MGTQSISAAMEKYVMPVADKMGNECHLRAIRDAFMSLLPITFIGGIAAVLSSAPSVETAGTGFTLGWAKFVESNSTTFSWINALTLGAFFSTMDWKAPILIIVLIILDGILYFPFFKIYEKKMVKMEQGELSDESDGRS